MKLFFTILVVMFVGCHSIFAASDGDKEAQQKMAELQQLLSRAMKSDTPEVPDTMLNQNDIFGKPQPTVQAPIAGAVGVPPAVDQNNAQLNNNTISATAAINPPKPSLYDEAFSGVINQTIPMSPEQIAKLRQVFTQSQLAAATPPGVPPKPTSTSLLVDLSPQAVPPVIRLGAGYITSLVFVDTTGQPWPIAAYSIGDPTAFNIQWDNKGNTLLIQSSTFYKRSNLAVILRDLNTPVMITLISGQEAVDYRVDLRVPGIGPNAIFMQNGIPESANPMLLDVLNGIAPKGSKELKVSGGDCKAWLLKNKLYLRTRLNIISPGWQSVMSSIDGTHAYQMQPAPVILALQNGRDKILTLMLEGLE